MSFTAQKDVEEEKISNTITLIDISHFKEIPVILKT
tara:strand:- start:84 stop:191 length:108 start_codon:yes stop_codon:yes gene_type:complete